MAHEWKQEAKGVSWLHGPRMEAGSEGVSWTHGPRMEAGSEGGELDTWPTNGSRKRRG